MITFILNNEKVSTDRAAGSSLADFIRYEAGLTGTKIGCREGDCGACTVLIGTPENGSVSYRSIVSCLTPLGNTHGKHIVTIEGIDTGHLSPVQKAFVDLSAIQCGFCTPGFVMSLTAECLSATKTTAVSAIASMSGNICRCTGYKSIEKVAEAIAEVMRHKELTDPVRWLVEQDHLPRYFLSIPGRLKEIPPADTDAYGRGIRIAGGTDLMVQKGEELSESRVISFYNREDLRCISFSHGRCVIGAAVTLSEAEHSMELRKYLPEIASVMKIIASRSVRNMATIAGNIVNGSPIGDMSVILLALNADVNIEGPDGLRTVPLKDFFLGYKKMDLSEDEIIRSFAFDCQPEPFLFNFEKVSKRAHLDIASVNTAIKLVMDGNNITDCHLSAGGVSPVPLYLRKTSAFLRGRPVIPDFIMLACRIMQEEISPISDVRGSAEYKKLLLRQLLTAHFVKLFPEELDIKIETL